MTFYQELQLNQAGSKNLLKKSETVKEKTYHILVYLVKIAVTMAFCFLFVTIFSILFGNENSIVGVVVLLCRSFSAGSRYKLAGRHLPDCFAASAPDFGTRWYREDTILRISFLYGSGRYHHRFKL